jgi:hypothetical protein
MYLYFLNIPWPYPIMKKASKPDKTTFPRQKQKPESSRLKDYSPVF